ncbi:hypothetical protein V6N13_039763 [Hibiscus sabdariffa]
MLKSAMEARTTDVLRKPLFFWLRETSSKTQLAGSGVGAPMRMFHPCLHKPLRLRVEATRGLTAEDALCPKSLSQPHPPAPSGLREHSLDLAGGQSKIQPRFPPRITRLLFDLRVKK